MKHQIIVLDVLYADDTRRSPANWDWTRIVSECAPDAAVETVTVLATGLPEGVQS